MAKKTAKYDLEKLFAPYPGRKLLFAVGTQVFLRKKQAEDHKTSSGGEIVELTNPKFK